MLSQIAIAHRDLARKFRRHDPVALACSFSGLLLLPELQRNNLRIESLVHMALAWASGTRSPSASETRDAFLALSKGPCGYLEDPPEGLFVELVRSLKGQHRILAGTWESAGFYSERIVDVVQLLPKSGGYDSITTAATALLTLSDAICERAGLQRYQIGGEAKQSVLTVDLVLRARRAVSHLSFTHDELNELGILPKHLEPFILDGWDPTILSDDFGRTILERHPIVRTGNGIAVVLPTAISTALRFFVVGTLQAAGLGEPLARALAQTHAKALERNRVMGGRDMQDLPFMKTKGALIGATVAEVEPGRYLQTILVIDDLTGFADTGLTEPNPHADDVLNAIESFVVEGISETIKRPDFREGLVLVVMGGAGRAAFMGFRDPPDPRWDIRGISAPDVETLDSLDRVTALTLDVTPSNSSRNS